MTGGRGSSTRVGEGVSQGVDLVGYLSRKTKRSKNEGSSVDDGKAFFSRKVGRQVKRKNDQRTRNS